MYSSGGTGPWIDLGLRTNPLPTFASATSTATSTPTCSLRASDRAVVSSGRMSGADNSFKLLAHDATPLKNLRFGDFNGDVKTDVFSVKRLEANSFDWRVSYGGAASWVQVNSSSTKLANMRFGDFNQDGHTDVFTMTPDGSGHWNWWYSPSATSSYVLLGGRSLSLAQVRLAGDFNRDRNTDLFWTSPHSGDHSSGGTTITTAVAADRHNSHTRARSHQFALRRLQW